MWLLMRFIAEENGGDFIEYALLTTSVGLCAVAAFEAWRAAINGTYSTWNTNVNKLWDPDPK
jgi:Flp pilus assembly pilin Flp